MSVDDREVPHHHREEEEERNRIKVTTLHNYRTQCEDQGEDRKNRKSIKHKVGSDCIRHKSIMFS